MDYLPLADDITTSSQNATRKLTRVEDGECWRWSELGWRCCTRVSQGETKLGVVVRMKANED